MKAQQVTFLSIMSLLMYKCAPVSTADIAEEAKPLVEEEPKKVERKTPYEIVTKENLNFRSGSRDVIRVQYRIRVQEQLSEQQLKKIGEEIIGIEKKKEPFNAISIFFYLPSSNAKSYYTAGMVEWAPHGDWKKAHTVLAGDYSLRKFVIKTGSAMGPVSEPKDPNLPEDKRKEIFYNSVAEQVRGSDSQKSYQIIAGRYNIDVDAVKNIAMEGLSKGWPMPWQNI
ncbi:MAG: hypothetical protein V3T99_03590 [Nitrososphaerales archaeon]